MFSTQKPHRRGFALALLTRNVDATLGLGQGPGQGQGQGKGQTRVRVRARARAKASATQEFWSYFGTREEGVGHDFWVENFFESFLKVNELRTYNILHKLYGILSIKISGSFFPAKSSSEIGAV